MFISALTGQRLYKLFDMIDFVIENHSMRVETGILNEIMAEAVAMQQPPSDKGKRLKVALRKRKNGAGRKNSSLYCSW